MKRLTLLLLVVLLAFSCQTDKKEEPSLQQRKTTIINGTIENYAIKDSIFEIALYYNDYLAKDQVGHKFKIDSTGKFIAEFDLKRQQDVFFFYKNYISLILKPGDSIAIRFNGSLEDDALDNSIVLEGNSSKINQLYIKYRANNPVDTRAYYEKSQVLKPKAFLAYNDSISKAQSNYTNAFIKKNNVPEDLKNWLNTEAYFEPLDRLLNYELMYNMKRRSDSELPKIEDDFFASLETIVPVKKEHLINANFTSGFINFYYYYLDSQFRKGYSKDSIKKIGYKKVEDDFIKHLITKEGKDTTLTQLVVNEKLRTNFNNNSLELYENNKDIIDGLFKGTAFENAINERYSSIKTLLDNPELPEKAELLAFKSTDAKTFLDEIKANAKGKVIYIDNWATWCGPCKSQFKEATPKLKAKFSKDVEFVYLCHQSEERLWKPNISEFKVEGKHYFITKDQTEVLSKILNITGFPTYNIINKDGELVHSGFEYRPSITETSTIIEKLIKE